MSEFDKFNELCSELGIAKFSKKELKDVLQSLREEVKPSQCSDCHERPAECNSNYCNPCLYSSLENA